MCSLDRVHELVQRKHSTFETSLKDNCEKMGKYDCGIFDVKLSGVRDDILSFGRQRSDMECSYTYASTESMAKYIYVFGFIKNSYWGSNYAIMRLSSVSSDSGGENMMTAFLAIEEAIGSGAESTWSTFGLSDEGRKGAFMIALRNPMVLMEACVRKSYDVVDPGSSGCLSEQKNKYTHRVFLYLNIRERNDVITFSTETHVCKNLFVNAENKHTVSQRMSKLLAEECCTDTYQLERNGTASNNFSSHYSLKDISNPVRIFSVRELLSTDFSTSKETASIHICGIVVRKTIVSMDPSNSFDHSRSHSNSSAKRRRDGRDVCNETSDTKCKIILRDECYSDTIILYLPLATAHGTLLGLLATVFSIRLCFSKTDKKSMYLKYIKGKSSIGEYSLYVIHPPFYLLPCQIYLYRY